MLEKLFTVYWNQVTLLLVAFSYFVKRVYDTKSKKIEINHAVFQQSRIVAVNNFFSAYAKTEFTFKNLSIWQMLEHKVDVKEIDRIIWPAISELKRSVLELRIFFPAVEHILFETILNNIVNLNSTLSELYFDYKPTLTIVEKANDFSIALKMTVERNQILLDDVSDLVQKTFTRD